MSRYITGLRLSNWMRFRGEHELVLEPITYSIVAEHEENPARSNYIGKSILLEAVRFCLFGKYSANRGSLDALISRGEDRLQVDVELDDGTFVTRSRERGEATKLLVTACVDGRERDFKDQAELERLLAMDDDNFTLCSYFQQKQMSRVVTMDPAPRTELVVEWLGVERLDGAAARVGGWFREKTGKQQALRDEKKRVEQRMGMITSRGELELTIRILEDHHAEAARLSALNVQRERIRTDREQREQQLLSVANTIHDLEVQLAALTEAPVEKVRAAVERTAEKKAVLDAASEKLKVAERNACGKFDGKCPVMREGCPAEEQVAAVLTRGGKALTLAREEQASAHTTHRLARMASEELERQRTDADRIERRIDDLVARRQVLEEEQRKAPELPPPVAEQDDPQELLRQLVAAKQQLAQLDADEKRSKELDKELVALDHELAVHRVASTVLVGSKREASLRFVEYLSAVANADLAALGVDLSVALEWGRPTQQLEDSCPKCGAAFPKSAKAKRCVECDAPRGFRSDGKLHVTLSNVSGAAEDLGGIAIQLAASKWRRNQAGCDWAVALVDEPFGALDLHNRMGVARGMLDLFRRGGFRQAFVIAHDRQVTDVFPARIQVTGDDQWSTVRVLE
jgi:DNA repair exonuclease SbcCD ATPase subunit